MNKTTDHSKTRQYEQTQTNVKRKTSEKKRIVMVSENFFCCRMFDELEKSVILDATNLSRDYFADKSPNGNIFGQILTQFDKKLKHNYGKNTASVEWE